MRKSRFRPTRPEYPTGRLSARFSLGMFGVVGSAGSITLSELYATPFLVGAPCRFDRIAVPTLSVASSLIRLGIYTDNRGKPDKLLLDAGQVSCASATTQTITIDITLRDVVWLAGVGQSVAPSPLRHGYAPNPYVGCNSPYSTGGAMGYSQSSITGALPTTWGSTYTERASANVIPFIYLRAK